MGYNAKLIFSLKKGDFLVDVSTNVEFLELWPHCMKNGVRYLNTALELWESNENAISFPKNDEELYRTSLGHIKDQAEKMEIWDTQKVVHIHHQNREPHQSWKWV